MPAKQQIPSSKPVKAIPLKKGSKLQTIDDKNKKHVASNHNLNLAAKPSDLPNQISSSGPVIKNIDNLNNETANSKAKLTPAQFDNHEKASSQGSNYQISNKQENKDGKDSMRETN